MRDSKKYDVIVVGAGSMGMAAGYYLASQGKRILLLDRYDPPHTNGSHHGDTRIIRYSYGEGRSYVPLVLRAGELWSVLEKETGMKLFEQTGVLSIGKADSLFIKEEITCSEKFSLPLELLEGSEIMRRWPGIQVPKSFIGCLEPSAGVLYSEECIRAYRKLAIAHGATLLTHTPVKHIGIHSGSVSIRTENDTYEAEALVLTSGAWAGKMLADLNLNVPLKPVRRTVAWFESEERIFGSQVFPAFIFDLGKELYYGFPSIRGCGVKLGFSSDGQPVNPDHMEREFGAYPEDEENLRRFLNSYMPQANGKLKQGKVCLYTYTPDEHFVIDRHPEYPHVAIAAGFSGHGFKFSSVVGELLCQLVLTGKPAYDISCFSIQRPSLQEKGGMSLDR